MCRYFDSNEHENKGYVTTNGMDLACNSVVIIIYIGHVAARIEITRATAQFGQIFKPYLEIK